jgi:hypothetical protein
MPSSRRKSKDPIKPKTIQISSKNIDEYTPYKPESF